MERRTNTHIHSHRYSAVPQLHDYRVGAKREKVRMKCVECVCTVYIEEWVITLMRSAQMGGECFKETLSARKEIRT